VTSRFPLRPALTVGLTLIASLALSGCTDALNGGRLEYVQSARLASDLKDKPDLQKAVRKALADLFGARPDQIKIPRGTGLPGGGYRLANYIDGGQGKVRPIKILEADGTQAPQEGGFALYRKHCLHCHGVSGAGDGPTSAFLYPRPRDYRKGIFKFTSTVGGQKPTRDDLRKTIRHGLHGTSMPAFEALMGDAEIEQVLDYMIFLTLRGETEESLILEAASSGELPPDVVEETARGVFAKWKKADAQVVNPPVTRTPPTRESILRGRELFLGKTTHKLECTGCHGPQGLGNGPSFINQDVFNAVVFGGKISTRYKLTAGQLNILEALSDLDARWNAQESHHADAAHTGTKAGHGESAVPPTSGNLVAALTRKLGISGTDKVESLKSKMGYEDVKGEEASTFTQIVENQLNDLEDKSLVSHGYGFHGTVYQAAIDRKAAELWNNSLDEWENPLRPNNLNRGVYKGGRRPIDIYWRIAKGINGAKMPAHFPAVDAAKIWDIVNFVLALPYEPALLDGATLPGSLAAPVPAVARR